VIGNLALSQSLAQSINFQCFEMELVIEFKLNFVIAISLTKDKRQVMLVRVGKSPKQHANMQQ